MNLFAADARLSRLFFQKHQLAKVGNPWRIHRGENKRATPGENEKMH